MGQRVGCGPEQHLARWPLVDPEHTNGRSRRILALGARRPVWAQLPPEETLPARLGNGEVGRFEVIR
jgi:hypothetical protein